MHEVVSGDGLLPTILGVLALIGWIEARCRQIVNSKAEVQSAMLKSVQDTNARLDSTTSRLAEELGHLAQVLARLEGRLEAKEN